MLLSHISGYKFEDFPQHLRVVHIAQEADIGSEKTPLQTVLESDEEKNYLESRQEELYQQMEDDPEADIEELNMEIEELEQRLEDIGARKAESRAIQILEGLQFRPEMIHETPTKALSGGWRMRVALACALFTTPDILLLDEPTNHLDFPAVVWLEKFLKNYKQTLVVVSHDRMFIDEIVTDIIELKDQKLTYFRGDYTTFERVKAENFASLQKQWKVQEKKIADLKQFIHENSFVGNENTAQLCKQKRRELEKLQAEAIPEPKEEKRVKIRFPLPSKLDHKLLTIQNMSFSWSGDVQKDPLLRNVDLSFDMGERIGVLGANGSGKTTLLKLITGELQPTEGTVKLNPHARVSFFSQHHIDQLDLDVTPREFLSRKFPEAQEKRIVGFLCSYGLNIKNVDQKIRTLSGGQKSRVAFAVINWNDPHFIIMDEPTNHLDLETIEGLIQALEGYQGGILVVSHDQYFLSKSVGSFWAVNLQGEVDILHDLQEAKDSAYKYNVRTAEVAKKQLKKKPKKKSTAGEDGEEEDDDETDEDGSEDEEKDS